MRVDSGEYSSRDIAAADRNPYVQLMMNAAEHAMRHGANSKPILAPLDATVLSGDVPMGELGRRGIQVIPWTTNDPELMRRLVQMGADGIITDRPDLLQKVLSDLRLASPDSASRLRSVEVSGHRGARGLRPENTLSAFEAALDYLVNTIEVDVGLTADGVPLLWHDAFLDPRSCRRGDGARYAMDNRLYIHELSFREVQRMFICDKLRFGPAQMNDLSVSPVSVAFTVEESLISPYAPIEVQELFRFTSFYVDYYANGPGRLAPDARDRADNARRVGFNLEIKIPPEDPRAAAENRSAATPQCAVPLRCFVDSLCHAIDRSDMRFRSRVLSFDFRVLLLVQEQYPDIPTCYLTGHAEVLYSNAVPAVLRAV